MINLGLVAVSSAMNIKSLRITSIGYLMLPNILFYFNWTNLPVCSIGVILLLWLLWQEIKNSQFQGKLLFTISDALTIAASAAFLTIISGVGGICYQTMDYWSHNTKLFELTTNSWPIRMPSTGPAVSYYFGYYLVPSLISKVFGQVNEVFLFVWTWIGIALGLTWAYITVNKKIMFVLIAITIGDFSHVVDKFLRYFHINLYHYGDFGIENWSNLENLFWVPNQFIPSLIFGGMMVFIIQNRISWTSMILPVALMFWWAIFPAFTSGILMGVLFIRELLTNKERINFGHVLLNVVLPAITCLPILIFFLSHQETPVSGPIWLYREDWGNLISEYLVNIGLNAAAFFLFFKVVKTTPKPTGDSFVFFTILALTLIFPAYRIGKVNDFLFRGMMPLLLIVGLYVLAPVSKGTYRSFWNLPKNVASSYLVILFLLAGTTLGITRIYRAIMVSSLTSSTSNFSPIPYDAFPSVYEVLRVKWSQQEANQYLGKADSFYERYISPR